MMHTIFIQDMKQILFSKDYTGQTFLHLAASSASPASIIAILSALPRQTALDLSKAVDNKGRTARELAQSDKAREYLDQAGKYPVEGYHLPTAPQVLVYYSTRNRQTLEFSAEMEKHCVEKFCAAKNLPCSVKRDQTADQILADISEVQADDNLSGLVVFIMSHGMNGLVSVEGSVEGAGPDFLPVYDIVTQMCCNTSGKPKVSPYHNYVCLYLLCYDLRT